MTSGTEISGTEYEMGREDHPVMPRRQQDAARAHQEVVGVAVTSTRGDACLALHAAPTRARGRAMGAAVRMACAMLLSSCAVRCDEPFSGTSRLGKTSGSELLSCLRYHPHRTQFNKAAVSVHSRHLPFGHLLLRGGGEGGQEGSVSHAAEESGGSTTRTRSVSTVCALSARGFVFGGPARRNNVQDSAGVHMRTSPRV